MTVVFCAEGNQSEPWPDPLLLFVEAPCGSCDATFRVAGEEPRADVADSDR